MFKALLVLLAPVLAGCNGRPASWTASVCVSPSFSVDDQAAIVAAADAWHGASGGAVALDMHVCDDGGDLHIQPRGLGPNSGYTIGRDLGVTLPTVGVMLIDADYMHAHGFETVGVATHEMGHWLGIMWRNNAKDPMHSSDPHDLMYFSANRGPSKSITQNDLTRLWESE